MYSGYEENRRLHGVSFIINKKTRKALLAFEPVNARLAKMRLKGKFNNITIISAYAPTEDNPGGKRRFL